MHVLHCLFSLSFKTKSLRITHFQCSPSILPLVLSLMPISYYLYINILQTLRNVTFELIAHDAHVCATQPRSLQVVEEDFDSKALNKWRKTTCHMHVPTTKLKEKLCKMREKKKRERKLERKEPWGMNEKQKKRRNGVKYLLVIVFKQESQEAQMTQRCY